MSAKRPATHELTHENWDRDEEPEERGTFRLATQNEMKNRVIKKAKRKCNNDSLSTDDSNSGTKSIFGGFTGFGKQSTNETDTASATSSPFAFLSKLSSNTQSTTTAASSFASSSNIFSFSVASSTPSSSTLSSGLNKSTEITSVSSTTSSDDVPKLPNTSSLFSMTKTTETTKTTEIPNSNTFSFGGSTQTTVPKTTFSFAKIPEKPATSTTSSTSTLNSPKTTFSFGPAKAADTPKSSSPPSTSTFSSTLNVPKSTFSLSNIKPTTNATFSFASTSPTKSQSNENANNAKQESKPSEMESNGSKEEYCGKLKALNIAVSEWIKMHVDKNPLCVLTPIFKDYEKYLQQIEEQKEKSESIKSSNIEKGTFTSTSTTISNIQPTSTTFSLGNASPKTVPPSPTTSAGNKTNGFSFGLNVDSKTDSKPVSTGFGFDVKSPNPPNTSSTSPTKPFTFTPTSTPFSFGNIKPPESTPATVKEDDDDDDEPPKVEFKQVMEENAIYSKKCKVFVKKDGNYVDKGVGTLYLKPVDSSDKTQLLVRADTNLGNILVNLILSASIPTKKMGKNNVMMVCVPSPDISKPTSMLLRVKTADEADELLEKIEMYKK